MNKIIIKEILVTLFFISISNPVQLDASCFGCLGSKKSSVLSQSLPDDREPDWSHSEQIAKKAEIDAWLARPHLFEDTDEVRERTATIIAAVSIAYLNNGTCVAKINNETVMVLPDVTTAAWENSGAISMTRHDGSTITFTPKDKLCPCPKKRLLQPLKVETDEAFVSITQDLDYIIKRTVWNKVDETLHIEYLDSDIDLFDVATRTKLL